MTQGLRRGAGQLTSIYRGMISQSQIFIEHTTGQDSAVQLLEQASLGG